MDDPKHTEIRQWLVKARHDVESAKVLAAHPHSLRDTAVYHCQQAAEKALKAYLTWADSPFQKIHDLTTLLAQCSCHDAAFSQHQDACEILTPYATLFRYPGEVMEPDASDVAEAIQLTTQILDFVEARFPSDVAGSV